MQRLTFWHRAHMQGRIYAFSILCKVLESCWDSDPGSNLGKLPESGGNQGEVPVSGLSGEFGSTCVVEGPNTWEATGGHGPDEVRVGWRVITEGLVAWGD